MIAASPTQTLEVWMRFCREHGSPCFDAWPTDFLAAWLQFQAVSGTLIVVAQRDEVLALGVGWQRSRPQLADHWRGNDAGGSCFLFSQVVAVNRTARRELIGLFNERWPHWRTLKLFAHRRGKLVRVWPEIIDNLFAYEK